MSQVGSSLDKLMNTNECTKRLQERGSEFKPEKLTLSPFPLTFPLPINIAYKKNN